MYELKSFSDKTVVITGASRGIGRATALLFAKLGANIVVNYAGNEKLANELVEEIKSIGVKAIAIKADVSKVNEAEELISKTMDVFQKVDILVNNAGITRDGLMMRMKEEDWDAVINTNLKGVFNCTKAVSKSMLKQRNGRIVNVTSVVGITGNAGQANYVAAKAGVIGLTKSNAKEFASRNITVNAVAPGFIETDMTHELSEKNKEAMLNQIPLKTFGQPEDVAKAIVFLASENASYLTGQVIAVDGGMVM